jgi:hypothetical protein
MRLIDKGLMFSNPDVYLAVLFRLRDSEGRFNSLENYQTAWLLMIFDKGMS